MKKISTNSLIVERTLTVGLATVVLISITAAFFSPDRSSIEDKLLVALTAFVLYLISGAMVYWSFKTTNVYLVKNGIFIKGIFKSEEVMLNNIYDLSELWFVRGAPVILKFNVKTGFGNWIMFRAKKEGYLSGRTPGLDALRRAIGK